MKKLKILYPSSTKDKVNSSLKSIPNANEIQAPLPYVKFLPETTPEIHQQFLHASGEVDYQPTLNYMFQALFQENKKALTCLICSVLHWSQREIKSIEITNPIILGKYIENKTFILDIKVLMNDNTIVNLEMQLNNYNNWPERSLGYLCRNFDNLNKGTDYIQTKSAIHIGFLDFTLFPNLPEFHATYKMQNIKNQNIYTDKFILHVIELNSIHLATKEDQDFEIDKWASFFKAKKWEDIHMLVNKNPDLQSVAETLYQLNMNEQLRETCDRFIRAEARENAMKHQTTELEKINIKLKQDNAELELVNTELKLTNSELKLTNSELELTNSELELANSELELANTKLKDSNTELYQALSDKDAEIIRLNTLLESLQNSNKQ